MSEDKNPEAVSFIPSAGTLARISRYIEMRKAFDGREHSITYVLEEAVDKGIDALVRSTENSITLRNDREYKNWSKNNPQPLLQLDGGALNPRFIDWQRTDNAMRRRYGIGATQQTA